MPREAQALVVDDLCAFAKSLRTQLLAAGETPSHLSLLNMLARAAGHRNLQALKARPPAAAPAPAPITEPGLSENTQRALRQFDTEGRLQRLPTRFTIQRLAMWGLWMHFDAKRPYTEAEVNAILNARHNFGDHCSLRRELVNMKLLARTADGAVYTKLAARPDEDAAGLVRSLRRLSQ